MSDEQMEKLMMEAVELWYRLYQITLWESKLNEAAMAERVEKANRLYPRTWSRQRRRARKFYNVGEWGDMKKVENKVAWNS